MEIWLNPDCSKCRTAVGLLDAVGAQYTVRRYLDDPPTPDELRDVLRRLGLEPWDLARTGEPVATELGLAQWPRTPEARERWIAALAAHPVLVQRPVIVADDGTAVLGRTPQAVADAAGRRRESRSTVRVLLVDPAGRVLLLHDSDPGLPGTDWWITPGGGIDPGESELDAVVREIAEETGHALAPGDVLGPLARRHVRHGYSDKVVEQDDAFYAARVPAFELDTAGHTEDEQLTLLGHHWWTRAELADTAETVWPEALAELLDLLERPGSWPVELPTVEESSVAI